MKKQLVVGILTYRSGSSFSEKAYLRRLVQVGRELGAMMYLFAPQDVVEQERKIRGLVPTAGGGWKTFYVPWPDVVIDYYRYYPKPQHRGYLAFRRKPLFVYANSRFHTKWNVYQVLAANPKMQKWLPETDAYRAELLSEMLARYGLVYVKPAQGTGGRGILRLEQHGDGYLLRGRTKARTITTDSAKNLTELQRKVNRWVQVQRNGKERFLIQQGLCIELLTDRTVDARLLIQKKASGEWHVTGMGMRVGAVDSSTANLHGGGSAVSADEFLREQFGQEQAAEIVQECHALAHEAADTVERHYGRMIEFGIDIGIDVDGHVWLIEMNPKPGRDILRRLGDWVAYKQAIARPLEYAIQLAKG